MPPAQHIEMRTKVILQMTQCHALLEKGSISKEQYDKLPEAMLEDIYIVTLSSNCLLTQLGITTAIYTYPFFEI